MIEEGVMKAGEKKQLVMIGIRRKGETGFKLKTLKDKVEMAKSGVTVPNCSDVSVSPAYL